MSVLLCTETGPDAFTIQPLATPSYSMLSPLFLLRMNKLPLPSEPSRSSIEIRNDSVSNTSTRGASSGVSSLPTALTASAVGGVNPPPGTSETPPGFPQWPGR